MNFLHASYLNVVIVKIMGIGYHLLYFKRSKGRTKYIAFWRTKLLLLLVGNASIEMRFDLSHHWPRQNQLKKWSKIWCIKNLCQPGHTKAESFTSSRLCNIRCTKENGKNQKNNHFTETCHTIIPWDRLIGHVIVPRCPVTWHETRLAQTMVKLGHSKCRCHVAGIDKNNVK
jgi:hypothetical protein